MQSLLPSRTTALAAFALLHVIVGENLRAAEHEVEHVHVLGHHQTASAAARLDAPVLDTPMSISTVSRELIDRQLVNDPQDALNFVSGAVRSASYLGVGETFILRGFEQADLVKDGFRAGTASNGLFSPSGPTDMANIERIEVLKGPTAILYGRGEPGGLVNYVTYQPTFENSFEVRQQLGEYDTYRTDIHANWNAIPGSLGLRLDASYNTNDSFIDHVEGERVFLAPSLLWQIGADTTLSVRAEYANGENSAEPGMPVVGGRPLANVPYDRYFGEPGVTELDHESFRGVATLDHRWNDQHRTKLSVHGNTAQTDGAYFILFNFAGPHFDPATGNVSRSLAVPTFEGDNLTLRAEHTIDTDLFAGTDWAIHNQLLAAYEYEEEHKDNNRLLSAHTPLNAFNPVYTGLAASPLFPFPGFPLAIDENHAIDASAHSLLLLDRIGWRDRIYISFGGRFEWFDADQEFTYTPGTLPNSANEQDPYTFNPMVGVVFKPAAEISLYFSYTEAQSSFLNLGRATLSGEALKPEQSRQFETGIKAELFDQRLVTTFAAFHIKKTDVAGSDPTNPLFSVNAGGERSQGFEFDLTGYLLPGWLLHTNYAFTDVRITDDPTGATTGNRRYGVPEHSGSVYSTYAFQRHTLRGLGIGGGVFAASQTEMNNGNAGGLAGYAEVDLLAWYERGPWRFQLNAKNALDKEHYFANGSTILAATRAPSRTVIGSIQYTF